MSSTANESRICELVETWSQAIRSKDAETLSACCAPDILTFALPPPLQNKGQALNRKNTEEWFQTWAGPIVCDLHELHIQAGEDLAYAHGINHLSGTKTDGEKPDVWFRLTLCFRKIGGQWLVTHEHTSVPFYMEPPFKAALDLTL